MKPFSKRMESLLVLFLLTLALLFILLSHTTLSVMVLHRGLLSPQRWGMHTDFKVRVMVDEYQ